MPQYHIPMIADKQCKGSVRYASLSEDAVLQSVYLSRTASSVMPTKIIVTVDTEPSGKEVQAPQ